MPQKLNGLTYPKTADELLADTDVLKVFVRTFASPDVIRRIKYLRNPPKRGAVFTDYISQNAPDQINFPNHIKGMATDLIQSNDHDPRLWQGIADLAEQDCRNVIESEYIPAFFDLKKCKAFEYLHNERLLKVAEKKFGSTDEVMIRTNLTDAPSVKAMLVALLVKDYSWAKNAAQIALRKANLNFTAKEVFEAVKTKSGLTQSGGFKVDIKKLKLCGFAKPGDAKLKGRVEDMVNAQMSGDKTTARQIWSLIQKTEPKESLVKTETIDVMFKTFKRFKVVA